MKSQQSEILVLIIFILYLGKKASELCITQYHTATKYLVQPGY